MLDKYLYFYLKCYLISNFLINCAILNELDNNSESVAASKAAKEFILNPEKLDMLLHTAAVITFLKSKANAIISEVPRLAPSEKIIYDQCVNDTWTAVGHARCVVGLLRARDILRSARPENKNLNGKQLKTLENNKETDLISQFRNWISPLVNTNKLNQLNVENTSSNLFAKQRLFGLQNSSNILARNKLPHQNNIFTILKNNKIFKRKFERKAMHILKIPTEMEKRIGRAIAPHHNKLISIKSLNDEQQADKQSDLFRKYELKSRIVTKCVRKHFHARRKRGTKVNVLEFMKPESLKRFFQPNVSQKRRKLSRRNLAGAAKSALQRGMPPDMPWYAEPLVKAMHSAKNILLQSLAHSVSKSVGVIHKARKRRELISMAEKKTNENTTFKNIDKLRRFYEFYKMYEHCQRYLKNMGESNSEFLNEFDANYNFAMELPTEFNFVKELQDRLKTFAFENFPILSPKIFSVFPEEDQSADQTLFKPSLLSPNLFSLHEEGTFSLPTLFKLILRDEKEVLGWLDLFMEVSGASNSLDKILAQVEPKMADLRDKLYPAVLKLEAFEERWESVRKSFSRQQEISMQNSGYVILNTAQKQFLHNNFDNKHSMAPKNKRGVKWSTEKHEELPNEEVLESDIYRIAQLSNNFSQNGWGSSSENITNNYFLSNQTDFWNKTNVDSEKVADLDIGLLKRPFLFGNKLRQAPTLNNVVLSPRAFATTLTRPGFLRSNVLSPSAFTSAILSPNAMLAVILSPTAFSANILTPNSLYGDVLSPKFFHTNIISPRALSALVLSPRTMLFEVLSPKMIEMRVLNPATFYVSVLTPNLIVPRVLSPNSFGVSVLSPSVLSPTVLSKGNFTVQVLSPSILGGELDLNKAKKPINATVLF